MTERSTNAHEEQNNRTSRSFTMLYDDLADELGLLPGAVLCAVMRYCQMADGTCHASVRTLAKRVHLNESTVLKYLKQLARDGYLEDLTPRLRFAPHTYRATAKASDWQPPESVYETNTRVCETNTSVCQTNASVCDDPLKRVLRDNQETPKENTRGGAARPRPPELALFHAAAEFNPPRQLTEDVIAAVRKMAGRLQREPTADDLRPFLKAWVSRGFRANNLAWLFDWAVSGVVPERSERSERKKGANGIQVHPYPGRDGSAQPLAERGRRPEPTPEQLAAYERANARRRAAIAALHDMR